MNDPRWDTTVALVEATDFERLCLWRESKDTHTWEEDYRGLMSTIGYLNKRPICVCVVWAKIDGYLVAFYDATSLVVDHSKVEDWLKEQAPKASRTNAMNFHTALHEIERLVAPRSA